MLRRFMTGMDFSGLNAVRPEKTLTQILPKKSGRNSTGKITARHDGGRQKRYYRTIDFKRNKYDISGKVVSIEYFYWDRRPTLSNPDRVVFQILAPNSTSMARFGKQVQIRDPIRVRWRVA